MFNRLLTLSVAATALSVGFTRPAQASDDAPRWKATGPFYAVVTRATERTTSNPVEDKEEKLKQVLVYEVTQKERKGGGWEMVYTLKRVSGEGGADTESWKRTEGIPFTLEFDAKMAFQKVGGIDKIVEKYAEGEDMPETEKAMMADLLTDGILNDFGEAYFPLPGAKPVTVKRKGGVAGLLTGEIDRTFSAAKAEKDGVPYRFEGSDKLKPADDQSAAPFKIVKLDEKKPAKTTGTTWIDATLGRPTRTTKEWSFQITMTVSANGQEADVTLTEKCAVDVKYLTKMPPDDR